MPNSRQFPCAVRSAMLKHATSNAGTRVCLSIDQKIKQYLFWFYTYTLMCVSTGRIFFLSHVNKITSILLGWDSYPWPCNFQSSVISIRPTRFESCVSAAGTANQAQHEQIYQSTSQHIQQLKKQANQTTSLSINQQANRDQPIKHYIN